MNKHKPVRGYAPTDSDVFYIKGHVHPISEGYVCLFVVNNGQQYAAIDWASFPSEKDADRPGTLDRYDYPSIDFVKDAIPLIPRCQEITFERMGNNVTFRSAPLKQIGFSDEEKLQITVACMGFGVTAIFPEIP
jgi:hypothetical protein